MKIFRLNSESSVANHFLAEMRDENIQKDTMRFRRNIERLGELMAYEVSKDLPYVTKTVKTPLGESEIPMLEKQPILMTVLRAGLPFYNGFMNILDQASSGFIGAYRTPNPDAEDGFEIDLGYAAYPNLEGRDLIIVDPMLATGRSLVDSIEKAIEKGNPRSIHIVAIIAAPEGVAYVKERMGDRCSVWLCAEDSHLNEKSYIIPGLGDAGDLAFGSKD
ncbi:uracil phosphoribosyltransferase [Persicobacter psychrovividus]|uniref:Uracil phosphoribosyltransferase n=1 Tax=Persicobacter psychrovividus TaxID=387638 RepID=A0ABM7VAP2_9BACT|nr:uracil phosphoribosyltransferase [Persicobacter psychrovividus]